MSLALVALLYLSSCDPVHDLKLENQSNGVIEVIYSPTIESQFADGRDVKSVLIGSSEMNLATLDSGETMRIGTVTARYTPIASDIYLNHLEVRYGQDTIKLAGRKAILSTIQKVEKLDWRLIVK